MKIQNFLAALLLILTSLNFLRCTPDQDFSTSTKDMLSQGKWSVDYYYEGQDKTAQFNGYQFTFTGNGSLSGTATGGEFTGNWSLMRDVSRNEVIEMNMQNQQPHLEDLNEQWSVTDKGTGIITMSNGSEQLRLRKL